MAAVYSFGEWLRQRRETLGLTRPELVDCAGCSVSALRKIEADERRPSRQLAELLASCLEIPTGERSTFLDAARGRHPVDRLPVELATGTSAAIGRLPSRPHSNLPAWNLPTPPTPLLGREAELAAVGQLLGERECRLLTLVGPGGIGKTRLGLEAACLQWQNFADGVFLVPLATTDTPEFMVPSIAQAWGLNFSGPIEPHLQLMRFLENEEMLLLLDNLEHLLDGVELVVEMLARAPGLKVLATSRERLAVGGEWVFEVQGLPVPPPDEEEGRLEQYSAVQLFLQRAQQTRVSFELLPEEWSHAAHICRMVEGIPLAIELAAAWVAVLSCAEIAVEIGRGLDFLRTTRRDIPERQRSIRATFDHSWKLLTAEEQRVLSRLSLFCCGFQREAAETVAGASLPLLSALVAKSFLRRTASGRFTMHELVRQYAASRFEESEGEEVTVRDRHCDFYLTFLRQREGALKSDAQQVTLQELTEEIDNLRAAWAWAVEREKFSLLGPTLRCIGIFLDIRGLSRQGIRQIEPLIEALRAEPPDEGRQKVLGQALTQKGLFSFRLGDHLRALALLEESIALLRPLGDPSLLVDPLVLAGIISHLTGQLERARSLLDEGLRLARMVGDQWYAAYALFNQGYIAGLDGRGEEGYRQMAEGITLWRALGDPRFTALGLNFICPLAISLGRVGEAKGYLTESLALSTEVGDRWGIGTAYRYLGVAALAEGNYAEARSLIRRSLDTFQGFVVGWDVTRSLLYLGEALAAAGDAGEAWEHFSSALELAVEAGAVPLALEAAIGLAELQAGDGEAAQALALAVFVLSHAASTRDTVRRAEQLRARMEPLLPPIQVATLEANGQQLSLAALLECTQAYFNS